MESQVYLKTSSKRRRKSKMNDLNELKELIHAYDVKVQLLEQSRKLMSRKNYTERSSKSQSRLRNSSVRSTMKIPPLSTRESISAVSPRFPDHKNVETQTRGKTQQAAAVKEDKESLDTLLSSTGAKDFKKRYYNNVSDSFNTFGNNGPDPILHIVEDWNESQSYEKLRPKEFIPQNGMIKTESPIAENFLSKYLPKRTIERDKKLSCRSTDTFWPKEKLEELVDESRRGFDDSVSIIIHENSFTEATDLQKQIQALQQQFNIEREQWMQHTRELDSMHQQEIDELTLFYENKLREMRNKTDYNTKSESDRVRFHQLDPDSFENLKEIHIQEKQALERRVRAECELKLEQQREKFYRENKENLQQLRENLTEKHEKEYTYLQEKLNFRLSANENRIKQVVSPNFSSKQKLNLSLSETEIDGKVREKLENLKSDYKQRVHLLEREKEDMKNQLDTSDFHSLPPQIHSTECSSVSQTLDLDSSIPSVTQQRTECNQMLCTKCKSFVQAESELTYQLNKFRRLLES